MSLSDKLTLCQLRVSLYAGWKFSPRRDMERLNLRAIVWKEDVPMKVLKTDADFSDDQSCAICTICPRYWLRGVRPFLFGLQYLGIITEM